MSDLLDRVLAEQRDRWAAGERPGVESFFERFPALAADPEPAVTLIYGEMAMRRDLGLAVSCEEYQRRFPDHAEALRRQWEVHEAFEAADESAADDPTEDDLTGQAGAATANHDMRPGASPPEELPSIPGFEVLRKIGKGGMGVVYAARQLSLGGREVALKRMLRDADLRPEQLARMRAEAQTAGQLNHNNIVRVYDCGEHEGLPHFTMELVEGESLAERLERGPLPPAEAAALVEALARAAQCVHDKQILHRDLKPANVLLSRGGGPKIADFGLARRLDVGTRMTGPWELLGTPEYMAPEHFTDGAEIGRGADVYALGAMLYEALTGARPFTAKDLIPLAAKILKEEPARPSAARRGIAWDLDTIALKCLEKRPERRYASAAELADDLEAFREGRPIKARPPGRAERAWRLVRRHPRWVTAAAFVVGCGAVLALTLAMRPEPPEPPAAPDPMAVAANTLRAEFAAGTTVKLLDGRGKPRYSVRHLREADAHPKPDAGGTLLLESRSRAVLEVAPPDPGRKGYLLAAEIQHQQSDPGEVGLAIYLARDEVTGAQERAACLVTFADLDQRFKKEAVGKRPLKCYLIRNRDRGDFFGDSTNLLQGPPTFHPALTPWRSLEVEVTPKALRIRWEGEWRATLTAETVRQTFAVVGRIPTLSDESGKEAVRDPRQGASAQLPRLSPSLGAGLFVDRGLGAFKNVTLRAVP